MLFDIAYVKSLEFGSLDRLSVLNSFLLSSAFILFGRGALSCVRFRRTLSDSRVCIELLLVLSCVDQTPAALLIFLQLLP